MEVKKPSRVRVIVENPDKPATVYFDRWKDVIDRVPFEIKMPQSAKVSKVTIFCINSKGNDHNVRPTRCTKKKLLDHAPCLNGNGWNSSGVAEFVKFAQEFCENASLYAVKKNPQSQIGSYFSDKGNFRIDYYNVISDGGRVSTTPARIHNRSGVIEVSKSAFIKCTVPSRMAILLHEFSHFNLNQIQSDEIEADLNALKIYLGLGYPVIEAHKGFLEVFKTHPSNANRQRYDYLNNFINNFENDKFRICLP